VKNEKLVWTNKWGWWHMTRSYKMVCITKNNEVTGNKYFWCDSDKEALTVMTGLLLGGEMSQENFDHLKGRLCATG